MFYPSKEEFIKLAKQGNLIPVYRELAADMETPVSAFKKIAGENAFLLESVEGGEKIARYSFLGSHPIKIFKTKKGQNPFAVLKKTLSQYRPVRIAGLPRFHGGLVGYLSYDVIRYIEDLPGRKPDTLNLPETQFMLTDTLLAFDHLKHKILIISNAEIKGDPEKAYQQAVKKILDLEKKLKRPLKTSEFELSLSSVKPLKFTSNFTKEEYEMTVKAAKEYVAAGDIIQVVPSQRFTAPFRGRAFDVYRILRMINPSPYMFYLKFGDLKLVGSSPEVMVRLEKGEAIIRPIAGTRPRGVTEAEDKKLAEELLASAKERAEHIMLVDLARNDLGRVCEYNSVEVSELMTIERYSHVMHIVSNVRGKLKAGQDAVDLFKASFPAGTVSGAPKVRAMEIIEELEPVRRGPYAGAVGYFDFSGEMDTCITIRTVVLSKGKAHVQAGGGVVADSEPLAEYQETLNKARGMRTAVELAQ